MARISNFICFTFIALGLLRASMATDEGVEIYELKKVNISAKFSNWGAALVSLMVPDYMGKLGDVILADDSAEEYKRNPYKLGAIVNRVPGGREEFNNVAWKVKKYEKGAHNPFITFYYKSTSDQDGFPRDTTFSVTYTLKEHTELNVDISARRSKKATAAAIPVNLVQHNVWHLGPLEDNNAFFHSIQIFASRRVSAAGAKIESVKGTAYDFHEPEGVNTTGDGYDVDYVLDNYSGGGGSDATRLRKAAMLRDDENGRVLELYTNAPSLRFASTKAVTHHGPVDNVTAFNTRSGVSLESQAYGRAGAVSQSQRDFASRGLYYHSMRFKFTTTDGFDFNSVLI